MPGTLTCPGRSVDTIKAITNQHLKMLTEAEELEHLSR